METSENSITLGNLPIGARLLVRSKKDWRVAVISKFSEEKATLIVCSAMGRTYRLQRKIETIVILDGKIPLIQSGIAENWRDNFTKYDLRW